MRHQIAHQKRDPLDLGYNIHLIDGFDLGIPSRTGSYVLDDEALTIIETGPSPSIPFVIEGLKDLGFNPKDVQYIIVTHIHLDHAGGAGLLLQECPQAKVVVHPKGARHLADPSKLIAGARAVYGQQFDALFDPILPIPEERLVVKNDNETLMIGPERTLTFLDTPGHAKHHFSIYDPQSHGIFTGDTVGVRYEQLETEHDLTYMLPSTSPNQFDPASMLQAIERIRSLSPARIYYGHFGLTEKVDEALGQVEHWIHRFVQKGEELLQQPDTSKLAKELLQMIQDDLQGKGIREDHDVYKVLQMDMEVCAQGIVDYLHHKRK